MMWVFAVLVVLAMGVVAMLAAGRGEPMLPAYDDRPDALVPADRPIGPDDLRKVRFSLAFRGYRMSEVDWLLDQFALVLEERDAGIAALRAQLPVHPAPDAAAKEEREPVPDDGTAAAAEEEPPHA